MNTFPPLTFSLCHKTKGQRVSPSSWQVNLEKSVKKIFFALVWSPLWNFIFAESNFRGVAFKGAWVDLKPPNNAGCGLGED